MRPQGLTSVLIVTLLLLPILSLQVIQAAPVSIVNIQLEPSNDVYVNQAYPDTIYDGSRDTVYVRSYNDGSKSWNIHTLIMFNLASVPPGSYVTYARLFLYMYKAPSSSRIYYCDRIVGSWGETTATWNNQPSAEGLAPLTTTTGTTSNVWISWDLKTWVQSIVARDIGLIARNYGFRISDKSEDSLTIYEAAFWSRHYSDPAFRPTLTMSYYPPHLVISASSDLTAGTWIKMTVQRKDYSDNPVTRLDLHVKLNSTSTSPNKRFSLTQGGAAVSEITIDNDASSKDIWYYDDQAGTWAIHAWTTDYADYGDDIKSQTVIHGPLDNFKFGSITSPQIAGVPFPITITAVDAYGNTVTNYTGTNSITDTTGYITPTATGAFTSGIWSGNVAINKVANNVKISTSGSSKAGVSNNFNVAAGAPAKVIVSPSSFSIASGVQFTPLTIILQDANGFNTTASSPITITLTTNSPQGEFRQVGTSTKITSVVISTGLSSANVDYYDLKGGTWALTASATGLTTGTSTATVIPDTAPPVTTITLGSPKYQSGTTIYVSNATAFTLSATDDLSGVRETKYRIDGGPWNSYGGPFTLVGFSDGTHTIGYYSADRAKNNETEKSLTAILDKTPPSVRTIGPIGSIIAKAGSISFRVGVEDTGSGVSSAELFIDITSQGMMTKEDGTFIKVVDVTAGAHNWNIRATDNLGYVAAAAQDTAFTLTIDTEPPTISNVVITPSSPVMGDTIRVSASIADPISGVREAAIFYSTDGGSTWTRVVMTEPMPPSVSYEGSIPSQGMMAKVQYYVEASDALDNAASSTAQEFTVGIPFWVYGAIGAVVVVLALAVLMRGRKHPTPPPPPPAPVTT
jgi:hypothetical protein